jgi:uncharacterized protein YoxC
MDITITIKDIILFLLGAGGIVLIVYLIVLVANLVKTLKGANKIVDDVAAITDIAAKRTEDIDSIITNVASSAKTISGNIKGKDGVTGTVSSIVGILTSLTGLFSKVKNRKQKEEEDDE